MSKRFCFVMSMLIMVCLIFSGCTIDDHSDDSELSGLAKKASDGDEPGRLIVHFIDVGQGDAIFIQTPAGQNMLIDGGERDQGRKVVNYLQEQGVNKIDFLVATHPHSDHIGGFIEVLQDFKVTKIYSPKVTHTTATFKEFLTAVKAQNLKISTARAGVEIPLRGIKASFVAPLGDKYKDLNNYSAVIRLVYGNNSFLFTGDAEKESEEEMLSSAKGNLSAQLLKVGHHGSQSSTETHFLNAVNPKYAVIMCGADNDYGHPHEETIEKLEQKGVEIYRTDQNGNVVVFADGKNIKIEVSRGSAVNADTKIVLPVAENDGDVVHIGNKKSKKYHCPDCRNLPKEDNRIYFNSREEAINAGYTPCSICHKEGGY